MTDVQAGFMAAPSTIELIGADGRGALPQIGVTQPSSLPLSPLPASRWRL